MGPAVARVLPHINQRVTVSIGSHEPVSSRVEDESQEEFVISSPNLPLRGGDLLVVSWEGDEGWFSLESPVVSVDDEGALPTISVSSRGRLSRFNERRTDVRRLVVVPVDLRVVVARVVKPGRTLQTQTVEISGTAIRFTTSAPFAPGDVLEAKIMLREGEPITARIKVIRMDSVSGSWRQTCTASYDDILRSDRARLINFLEQVENAEH